jgi:hypothetical protein
LIRLAQQSEVKLETVENNVPNILSEQEKLIEKDEVMIDLDGP